MALSDRQTVLVALEIIWAIEHYIWHKFLKLK